MRKSSTVKNKTMWTHLMWLSVMVVSVVLFAKCYEFAMIDQPTEAPINSSFDVPIIIKQEAGQDFNYDLSNFGILGVELPDGWTVDDSIAYNVKGTYVEKDPFVAFEIEGFVVFRDSAAQMYEDSVGSEEGYYWWGGVTSDTVWFDNLDSASLTITINVGDKIGQYHLRYAVGDYEYWNRTPFDNEGGGGLTEPLPIKATWPTNIERYLKEEISVFPNPAYDVLNVNVGGIRTGTLQLYDISGKLQFERNITSKETTINVSDLVSGIYIMKVNTDKGVHSEKILIK